MPADLGHNWRSVDGDETVTYFQRATESTFSPPQGTPVTHAKRFEATVADLLAAGALLQDVGLIWWLWTGTTQIEPKRSDVIQDKTGARWTVLRVVKEPFACSYELTTIKEVP
jgi:hypothetical protein